MRIPIVQGRVMRGIHINGVELGGLLQAVNVSLGVGGFQKILHN